jgi:hypothetical protein
MVARGSENKGFAGLAIAMLTSIAMISSSSSSSRVDENQARWCSTAEFVV